MDGADQTIKTPEAFYEFLLASDTRVLSNIIFAGSPGHQILELDYFLRKFHAGLISRERPYLWVQRAGPVTTGMAETYGPGFRQYRLGMAAHDQLFGLATTVTQMMPELGVDVGLSHIKYSVADRRGTHLGRFSGDLYYMISNASVIETTLDYYALRARTEDFRPWTAARPPLDGPLAGMLGAGAAKYAVVHIRNRPGNAGTVIPPEALHPSLELLRDAGYAIVKAGTEPYPESFAHYGVINYTDQPFRVFKNDLALMANASLCVINGSGFANLADVMDIPVVDYGRWHLSVGPFSKKTVVVPTLLMDPTRKRMLTLGEQMLFFKTRHEFWEGKYFGWHFPFDRFVPRAPEAVELRAAVAEAIDLTNDDPPLTPLQLRFNQLDEFGLLSRVRSRLSQTFLERTESLL